MVFDESVEQPGGGRNIDPAFGEGPEGQVGRIGYQERRNTSKKQTHKAPAAP